MGDRPDWDRTVVPEVMEDSGFMMDSPKGISTLALRFSVSDNVDNVHLKPQRSRYAPPCRNNDFYAQRRNLCPVGAAKATPDSSESSWSLALQQTAPVFSLPRRQSYFSKTQSLLLGLRHIFLLGLRQSLLLTLRQSSLPTLMPSGNRIKLSPPNAQQECCHLTLTRRSARSTQPKMATPREETA